ncbi:unnamed protein product [Phytomonas sp. EM1]|nr:unnamed protein product [Phytomonas sp. EM1]|eukprot:CCW61975.1 unnamed protein product [Phytomonas sp. isolate EM1]
MAAAFPPREASLAGETHSAGGEPSRARSDAARLPPLRGFLDDDVGEGGGHPDSLRKERLRRAMRCMNFICRYLHLMRESEAELRGIMLAMMDDGQI